MNVRIVEIEPGDAIWEDLLAKTPSMDEPIDRYLHLEMDWIRSNHILAAVSDEQPVGVLRLITHRLGEDEERPPIAFEREALIEGKVVAFEVVRECRRQGIGRALQERAMEIAREEGCHQLRSTIWYSSPENFSLQLSMNCGVQPGLVDDSAYSILAL